jgi:hypothetical protein
MTSTLQERGDLPESYRFENNRYVKSVFETGDWTSEQVEHMAHSSFLKAQLIAFARQPEELYKSYLQQPFYWFGSFLRYLRNVRELAPAIDRIEPIIRRLERARM